MDESVVRPKFLLVLYVACLLYLPMSTAWTLHRVPQLRSLERVPACTDLHEEISL
jgi:hypothetical protein